MTSTTFKRYVDAIVSGTIGPVVDVAIVPINPTASLAPVVDVALVPVRDADHVADGSGCSSSCGQCGRCTDGVNTNYRCDDCGEAFWKGEHDADAYCDGCRARRDAWAEALELRMAKSTTAAAAAKKEVA